VSDHELRPFCTLLQFQVDCACLQGREASASFSGKVD